MASIFMKQKFFSGSLLRQFKYRKFHQSAFLCARSSDDIFNVVPPKDDINPVVGQTLPEFLWSNLHKWENAPAFECGISGRKYNHSQAFKQSRGFATALKQHGLKSGDVVALFLPNIPEYAAIILGILDAGIVASPFNPTYTSHEIATQVQNCEAKCIVTLPQFLPQVKEAQAQCPSLKSIILVGEGGSEGTHSYFEMVKANPQGVTFLKGSDINCLEEPAILPWSSGTTGPPKGVVLTHSSLATNLHQITQPGYLATTPFEGGNEQNRFIGILPFFHIYGFVLVMAKTLYQGSFTMTLPKFEPATFMKAMRKQQPTFLHLVPPLISFLGASEDVKSDDFKSVIGLMGGAAPIGPAVINRVLEKAKKPVIFQEGYGMTEMSPVTHITPYLDKLKVGSCGIQIPGTLCKVLDIESGEVLGPNTPGELLVKGPQIMRGYYKNEKATKETIDSDGWLHTGDTCIYDQDKNFFIVDRLKELIKVRGFQVAPSELEDLLRTHPEISDVAVIGVPCERSGELPRAYIVTKPSSKLAESDVHSFIDAKVSPHKKLKGGVELIHAIPKAASGKILRRELKKNFLAKHHKHHHH